MVAGGHRLFDCAGFEKLDIAERVHDREALQIFLDDQTGFHVIVDHRLVGLIGDVEDAFFADAHLVDFPDQRRQILF